MELIVAMFILVGWYAYKKYSGLKKSEPTAPSAPVVEADIVEKKKATCDFCDGRRYLPSPTIEKMPCPKCSRDKKIS